MGERPEETARLRKGTDGNWAHGKTPYRCRPEENARENHQEAPVLACHTARIWRLVTPSSGRTRCHWDSSGAWLLGTQDNIAADSKDRGAASYRTNPSVTMGTSNHALRDSPKVVENLFA